MYCCTQDLTQYHIDQWVDWSNNLDYVYANWMYFLLGMRPSAEAGSAMPAAQARFEKLLTALDAHMVGRKWLVGDGLTLAVRAVGFMMVHQQGEEYIARSISPCNLTHKFIHATT